MTRWIALFLLMASLAAGCTQLKSADKKVPIEQQLEEKIAASSRFSNVSVSPTGTGGYAGTCKGTDGKALKIRIREKAPGEYDYEIEQGIIVTYGTVKVK